MIVIDAARARSFSCYGYGRRTTPSIDAFAANAIRYSNATTSGPWSLPGHVALFTGLVFASSLQREALAAAQLPQSVVTIAEMLSARFSTGETAEIRAALAEAEAELARGEGLSSDEMRRHFGLQ